MGQKEVGTGGFCFPEIYKHNKTRVESLIKQGIISLVECSRLTLADKFMAFILQSDFLKFCDCTYPNPRRRNEIPVWFLISCQFVLRLSRELGYQTLETLLKSGPVLSRVGFNVSAPIGFNDKNTYPRKTPVHQDSVRKFFKDTNDKLMRNWFNVDMQRWFERMGCFDTNGIFILDQTHLVVPDNKHYEDAVRMPVDEHGQRYKNFDDLTTEQRKSLTYHPCYTLSVLLHLSYERQAFHIAAYDFGPGNEDELPQGKKAIKRFFENNITGGMKLLIVDRGYISGEFITWLKTTHKVDILVPLRRNMEQSKDAIAISEMPDAQWVTVSSDDDGEDFKIIRACTIEDVKLWDDCKVPLYTTVIEIEQSNDDGAVEKIKFALCSTRKFDTPHEVVSSYRLRTRVEECFRQFKNNWHINRFPSPYRSLLEAHVGFTLLTYSLLQLYLLRHDLQDKTNKFLTTLLREELNSKDKIIVYANKHFGCFSVREYTLLINQLPTEVREIFSKNLSNTPNQD